MKITWEGLDLFADSPEELAREYMRHVGDACRDAEGATRLLAETQLEIVRRGDDNCSEWVEAARTGNPDHVRFCAELIEVLSEAGQPLPLELARLAKELALGRIKVRRRGRPPGSRSRALAIRAVALLTEAFPGEIKATRNEATEKASASSIVAQAMKEIGIDVTEGTVSKMWAER